MSAQKFKIRFGKYKGQTIDEICAEDPDYIIWLLDNVDLDEKSQGLFKHTIEIAQRNSLDLSSILP